MVIDTKHTIIYKKIIIDDMTVITGSFNFTKNAEGNNAQNLLIINNQPKLAKEYRTNFQQRHWRGERYEDLERSGARQKSKPRGR